MPGGVSADAGDDHCGLEPARGTLRRGRRLSGLLALLLAVAGMIVPAGCVVQVGSQPVLRTTELAATWASRDGGSITFAASHRFTAAGLRLGMFWSACAGRGKISGSGNWQFLNSRGDSGAAAYSTGSLISLVFDGRASSCTAGQLTLTSWNVGPKRGLCVQFDPDTPCDGYVFDKR